MPSDLVSKVSGQPSTRHQWKKKWATGVLFIFPILQFFLLLFLWIGQTLTGFLVRWAGYWQPCQYLLPINSCKSLIQKSRTGCLQKKKKPVNSLWFFLISFLFFWNICVHIFFLTFFFFFFLKELPWIAFSSLVFRARRLHFLVVGWGKTFIFFLFQPPPPQLLMSPLCQTRNYFCNPPLLNPPWNGITPQTILGHPSPPLSIKRGWKGATSGKMR